MFTPFVRFIILAICVCLSIAAAYYDIKSLLIMSAIVSLVILYGYFKVSTVFIAVRASLAGNMELTEKYLKFITQPDRLTKKNQLYYLFANGMLLRSRDEFVSAIQALGDVVDEKKLPIQYRNIALIALVDMYLVQKDKAKAKQYFDKINLSKVAKNLLPTVEKMRNWVEA